MYYLNQKDLSALLLRWTEAAEVYAPKREAGQVMLMPYDEEAFTMNYVNFAFPLKEHLFRQREVLFSWEEKDGNILLDAGQSPPSSSRKDTNIEGKRILFGVRPCEVDSTLYTDKFFLSEYHDEFYARNRRGTAIVAVNCIQAGETCFCSSMGTGPFATEGYDLLFTSLEDRYLVEVGSDLGENLILFAADFFRPADSEAKTKKEKAQEAALDTFVTRILTDEIAKVLEENFDHPIWEEKAKDCIGCNGCTILCPTCTCFNVVEEATGESSGCRVRYWDSCQSDSFTRNANQQNPRDAVARVRYRVYDKFKYIDEKFHMKGCNGCGRCINVCPAAIDVVEIINLFAEESGQQEASKGKMGEIK
jgi:formate hydrogenlyase subunit 6/NADH:ubiquinone oxidoreductase subunit I